MPASAVLTRRRQTFVWVVEAPASTVSLHKVDLREDEGGIRVTGGLAAGARIVTAGIHSLKQGQQVRIEQDWHAMKSFNLSDWALGHRSLVWYFMIAFMAAGLFSYLQLGRQEDPDFTIKTMVIQAQWPGASPEEMTRQVTDRIEKKLEELESLDYTKSVTVAGQTTVFVYLRDTTKAADVAPTWARVRNMIADIKGDFPQGVIGPGFNDRFGDVFGNIYAFTSDGLSQRQLRDRVEDIRAKVSDRAECRQGRHSGCAGRSDLPRIFDAEDRGSRPRHPLHHVLAAGAKCRRAVWRVPGRAGAHQRAGQRSVRIGSKA